MTTQRVVRKSLACEEDILFGKGQVTQTRNGQDYDLQKVTVAKPVDTIEERDALDTDLFPYCTVAGIPYRWDGNAWLQEDLTSAVTSTKLYDTIASLKVAEDAWLIPGQFVETGGYYSKGDGGGARYLIATPQAADEFGDHTLANGNVALLQDSPTAVNFGAKTDKATDAAPSIVAAFNALGDAGGVVRLPASGQILIDQNITIPPRCFLIGEFDHSGLGGLTNQTGSDFGSMGSAIILSNTATISIGGTSGISNALIYRKGMTFPAQDATLYSGTAIQAIGDDPSVVNCLVIGFETAFTSAAVSRVYLDNFKWDCNPTNVIGAAVYIENSFDSSRLTKLSGWPYGTIEAYSDALDGGGSASSEAYRLHRAGSGLKLTGANDDTFIDPSLVFGYAVNYDFVGSSSFACGLLWSDNTGFNIGSVGVRIGQNCSKISIRELVSWSSDFNFVCNALATETIHIGTLRAVNGVSQNAAFGGGDVTIDFLESVGSLSALRVTDTDVRIKIGTLIDTGNALAQVIDVGVGLTTTNNLVVDRVISDKPDGSSLHGVNPVVFQPIASADPLKLPVNGREFTVTGNTGFGALAGGSGGRRVTLRFEGTLTVFDGGLMNLSGNFNATPGSTLELIHDSSQWLEVSRSTN